MNRYILDEKIGLSYNASSKARDDVALFMKQYKNANGESYRVVGRNDKSHASGKIEKAWLAIRSMLDVFGKVQKGDIILVQSSLSILKPILKIKKLRRFHIVYLIHDLDAIRDTYDDAAKVKELVDILNCADVLICHNECMIQELKARNCRVPMVNLQIFDYYTDLPEIHRKWSANGSVCFAGNLSKGKTGFLYELDASTYDIPINVYGKKEEEFAKLNYKGCFKPEELPAKLDGNWGLIWEGNDFVYNVESHPYIMLNNPHKASLYIVSGLPIIIWEKAAMASFVKEKGIGITINSLNELERVVKSVSKEEYEAMIQNLSAARNDLIEGNHLKAAVMEAEQILAQRSGKK